MAASSDSSQSNPAALLRKEWDELSREIQTLEEVHAAYVVKLAELHKSQKDCLKTLQQHDKRLGQIKDKLRGLQSRSDLEAADAALVSDVHAEVADKRSKMLDMRESLPREFNGLYLNIILGDVDVSLLNKQDKFKYKAGYEKFKLVVTLVCMMITLLALVVQQRVFDAILHFLLVWYYCTLTIRESILRINGSRIKGWWVLHHYIAAVLCGVLITWPDRAPYLEFRRSFLYFTMYLSLVQLMQYFYQRGSLYRLRSLGLRQDMDVTVEGFQSWMFRGLTFLLPFLFIGYLYMAYLLYWLWNKHGTSNVEWQVYALFVLFLVIAVGNVVTTLSVVYKKFTTPDKPHKRRRLETKYSMEVITDDENPAKKDD